MRTGLLHICLLLPVCLAAQPIVSVPEFQAQVQHPITVPVVGTNFEQVSSLSWHLKFSNTVLMYIDYVSVAGSLTNGNLTINQVHGDNYDTVAFSWSALSPVSFACDTLVVLRFLYYGGMTNITFCQPLTPGFIYQNGAVSPVVSIQETEAPLPCLSAYPNPAGEGPLHLEFRSAPGTYAIALFSADGRKVLNTGCSTASGTVSTDLDIRHLGSGPYILQITGTTLAASKLILVR